MIQHATIPASFTITTPDGLGISANPVTAAANAIREHLRAFEQADGQAAIRLHEANQQILSLSGRVLNLEEQVISLGGDLASPTTSKMARMAQAAWVNYRGSQDDKVRYIRSRGWGQFQKPDGQLGWRKDGAGGFSPFEEAFRSEINIDIPVTRV